VPKANSIQQLSCYRSLNDKRSYGTTSSRAERDSSDREMLLLMSMPMMDEADVVAVPVRF